MFLKKKKKTTKECILCQCWHVYVTCFNISFFFLNWWKCCQYFHLNKIISLRFPGKHKNFLQRCTRFLNSDLLTIKICNVLLLNEHVISCRKILSCKRLSYFRRPKYFYSGTNFTVTQPLGANRSFILHRVLLHTRFPSKRARLFMLICLFVSYQFEYSIGKYHIKKQNCSESAPILLLPSLKPFSICITYITFVAFLKKK